MKQLLKVVEKILKISDEKRKIVKIVARLNRKIEVLDVGCGYGEKIKLFQQLGFLNILGVEKNVVIATEVKHKGLPVIPIEKFQPKQSKKEFDLLIFSHIIEHFEPKSLLTFLESYFETGKEDGYVLIITPMLTEFFYNDFDHIKPYSPNGIEHIFSGNKHQVQFYSKFRLEMVDIYFRRMPFHFFKFTRSIYLGKKNPLRINPLIILINLISSIVFIGSMGIIGRTTGWIGLYKLHKN